MINVGVLWDHEVEWNRDKPFDMAANETYEYFSELARDEGVELFSAKYSWYNEGGIDRAWAYRNGNWIKVENVKLDAVHNKFTADDNPELDKQINSEVGILNHPELERLCKDKLMTYERFTEHVPETRLASSENIDELLSKFGKIVLKPVAAYGAKGIHIVEKGEEIPDVSADKYIVQRFIDSSKGIDGLVNGSHDLRAIVVNGEIKGAYVRYNEDSEISNVSEGGVKEAVGLDEFPEEAKNIVEDISDTLEYSPAIFSVDFFFDPKGNPWIVELNSKPGLNFFGDKEVKEQVTPIMKGLINCFEDIAKD